MDAITTADGRRCRVELPAWGRWLDLLDEAGDGADAQRLLGAWLRACVRVAHPGQAAGPAAARADTDTWLPLTPAAIAELPAAGADALAELALAALAEQRRALALHTRPDPRGLLLGGNGIAPLLLCPWTFGERARVLRACLRLRGADVDIDHARFERAQVLCCARPVADADGPLTAEAIDAWPIPLGEAVTGALQQLNEPAADEAEVLRRCADAGLAHPDLDLAECCRVFGWTPAQAEALPAAQLHRLLLAQRLLDTAAARPAPGGDADNLADVTRILVRDA